jgi:hypothetical protein
LHWRVPAVALISTGTRRRLSELVNSFASMVDSESVGRRAFATVLLAEGPTIHDLIAVKLIPLGDGDRGWRLGCLPTLGIPAEAGWLLAANAPASCCDRHRMPPEREALDTRRAGFGLTFMGDTGMTIILGGRFIYSRGVIHRELKPANILIYGRGWPRIGDPASNRFMVMNVTMTIGVGTRLYMARRCTRMSLTQPPSTCQ